jgi:hypothetical protein
MMALRTRKIRNELNLINRELSVVKGIFTGVVNILSSFDITNRKVLPYGLRKHTRSVSWLVEQVIIQQTKFHSSKLRLTDVEIDMPDTCLHDCIIHRGDSRYFVNVKIHQAERKENKNDIAAVEKLYMQYKVNPDYRLIYACFGIKFEELTISFNRDYIQVFSPQFLPIYINPRNDKIQAFYNHDPQFMSRSQFLSLLRKNSKSIVLR